ncbi:GNAT family N-acetyltransferase [Arthrobacter sp. Ld5]|uniref:GNAT family N-acetyltransferase n=1 Tax=Arthrobacter sp. Ld5 TaxID=649152 RepID=UPI003EBC5BFE
MDRLRDPGTSVEPGDGGTTAVVAPSAGPGTGPRSGTGPPVHVTTATVADAAQLAAVAAVTFPLACPADSRPEDIARHIATQLSVDRFVGYIESPLHTILCLREGERVGGWSMVALDQPTDPDVLAALTIAPTVELSKFYVHPDQHGRGAAAALMRRTLELAADSGRPGVWLGVNQENARALRFYTKHGFRRVGTKRFRLGDRFEDDFILEQALPGGPGA